MGFGKSFGLGLLLYILLNFGMTLVLTAVTTPSAIGAIFTLEGILAAMFAPVLMGFMAFTSLGSPAALSLTGIFGVLLLILPGLLGALVAGKSSDSAGAAFGGWLLAAIVVAVIFIVLLIAFPLTLGVIYAPIILLYLGGTQLGVILAGVSVGFLWGGVAAASAGP